LIDENVKFVSWEDFHTKDTADQLNESVKFGVWIPWVDLGYWATDAQVSNVLVWKPKPEWATHIAWIEK
jgi:hypothetical protein